MVGVGLSVGSVLGSVEGWGTLKRGEAVSLLKELIVACPSFCTASAVSVLEDKRKDSWVLSVYWVPRVVEMGDLMKIVVKRGLEVVTSDDCVVFRSPKN